MYWEEKIEKLKREVESPDFIIPFTDWQRILKSIEKEFIVNEDSNSKFRNWKVKIRNKHQIKTMLTSILDIELDRLNANQNYWIVLANDDRGFKNLVYDVRPKVLKKLCALWNHDFCIVDKKYEWFTYFAIESADLNIFKSGQTRTPFDPKVVLQTPAINLSCKKGKAY